MTGVLSPDIPAYFSYVIVLLVGIGVARARVNQTLARYPDRWAFAGTWTIFFAYTILPVALFWFLDYTSVIRDTSLLAALLVAVGYRQIFAGNIQGITLSGQTALLWKPFDAWVQRVTLRIDELNTRYKYRFYEEVRSRLAGDPHLMGALEELVSERTVDPNAFANDLAPLKWAAAQSPQVPGASRRLVERLWRELREREPENYGYLLHRRGLIGRWQYWQWLEKGRSRLTSAAAILAALLLVFGIGSYSWSGPNRAWGLLKYEQTRFLKSNGSQRDYWRSRNYIASEMARVDLTETAEQTMARRAAIVGPLIDELTFKDITEQQAARTLRLIVDVHSQDVNQITVPRLIDSLRTENIDVRLRINGTLLDLQAADYPMASVDRDPFKPLKTWIPKADETPGETNHFVQLWKQWWSEAIQPPSSPAAPSTIEKTLETPGNVELKGVQFDFDRATLQPESGTVLAEVASILGRHPDWKVSIEGYTDSKGGARHNQDLSERRAGAVKSALIDMYHVDGSRLTSKGFGAASPIASNDTDDGRARNRRVELKRLP